MQDSSAGPTAWASPATPGASVENSLYGSAEHSAPSSAAASGYHFGGSDEVSLPSMHRPGTAGDGAEDSAALCQKMHTNAALGMEMRDKFLERFERTLKCVQSGILQGPHSVLHMCNQASF